MPFDGNTPDLPPTVQVIDKMREILGPNGENWLKGAPYHDGKVCVLAALIEASGINLERRWVLRYDANKMAKYGRIRAAIIRRIPHRYVTIEGWNDSLETTWPHVDGVLSAVRDELVSET